MRITKKRLRKIVKEEYQRGACSDDLLVQEGVLDFLDGIFKWMEGFMKDMKANAEKESSKVASSYGKSADSNVEKVASKLGVTRSGKGEGEPVKTIGDLDLDNPEHQKVFWQSVGPPAQAAAKNTMTHLGTAGGVENWTPKSDSEEDQKAWKAENGENAGAIFSAWGTLTGMLKWYGKVGIESAEKLAVATVGDGGWADGIKGVIDAAKGTKEIWDGVGATGAEDFGMPAAMDEIISKATEIANAISADAKEEMKECIHLRRLVNSMIVNEGPGDGKVRFTKRYLNSLIRESMKKSF
jgi:hypothetical protein